MEQDDFKFERKHNKDYFYKFTNCSTAKLILLNRKLRYSSPLIFNDPFDCQAGLHLEFNTDEFVKIFFDKVEQLILSEQQPIFCDLNDFSRALLNIRDHVESHGYIRKRILELLGPPTYDLAKDFVNTHEQILSNWQNDVKRMRLLCLSECFDDILMWSHYADQHKGLVIELKVAETEQEDDPLWLAQPIRYIQESAPLYSKDIFEEILGVRPKVFPRLFDAFAYVKYNNWHYEKEWRVMDLSDKTTDDLYEDNSFRANKINSIIFGCKCTNVDITDIIALVNSKYSHHVNFLKAKKHDFNYKLDFTSIGN